MGRRNLFGIKTRITHRPSADQVGQAQHKESFSFPMHQRRFFLVVSHRKSTHTHNSCCFHSKVEAKEKTIFSLFLIILFHHLRLPPHLISFVSKNKKMLFLPLHLSWKTGLNWLIENNYPRSQKDTHTHNKESRKGTRKECAFVTDPSLMNTVE